MYHIRKKAGLSRDEVAEGAKISTRTYTDIERGANMKADTLLHICQALNITPNDILTEESLVILELQDDVLEQLKDCTPSQRKTALQLLSVYLNSLK